MGTGYTRNDVGNRISNGSVVDANDLDGEFDSLEAAFNSSTGHTHDGTSSEGAPITVTGTSQEYVSGAGAFYPKTDDFYDLGTTTLKWKDLFVDGTANIDTLSVTVDASFTSISDLGSVGSASFTSISNLGIVDTADINGGTLDGVVVGGVVPAAGSFTSVSTTSTGTFGGNVSVTGNITLTGTVDGRDVAVDGAKLDGVEAGATADQTGAEIKALYELEADTNAFTDALKSKLDGVEANATADQTGPEIKALYEAELNTNAFTDAEKAKLLAIESGATADQTGAEIKALYELEADTNAFTDVEKSKLAGIEAGATGDLSGSEIKTLYEAEANTNAFTDADKGKLDGTTAFAANLVGWKVGGVAVTATAAELNLLDGVTATTAELNILDGVTATAAELNVLDGITATVTELNYTDGVTSNIQTQLDAKASLTGSETLTNKTLTAPVINGAVSGDSLATQAEAEAGTNNDQLMTPLTTAQAIDALAPISTLSELDLGLLSAGPGSAAHGAGGYPILVQFSLQCVSADAGFSVGDRIQSIQFEQANSNANGFTGYYNTTNAGFYTDDSIVVVGPSGNLSLDHTKWRVYARIVY